MEEKNMNHSKNNNRNDNNRLVDRNHNCQSIRSQRVGGLILAAGLSTRMGQSKPLTKFLDNNYSLKYNLNTNAIIAQLVEQQIRNL